MLHMCGNSAAAAVLGEKKLAAFNNLLTNIRQLLTIRCARLPASGGRGLYLFGPAIVEGF